MNFKILLFLSLVSINTNMFGMFKALGGSAGMAFGISDSGSSQNSGELRSDQLTSLHKKFCPHLYEQLRAKEQRAREEQQARKEQQDKEEKFKKNVEARLDTLEKLTDKINEYYKALVAELSKPNPCKKDIEELKKRIEYLEKQKKKPIFQDL